MLQIGHVRFGSKADICSARQHGQKRTRGLAMLQSGGFNSDVEGGEEKAQRCQKQLPQLQKGSDMGAASAKPNYSVKNIEPVVVGRTFRHVSSRLRPTSSSRGTVTVRVLTTTLFSAAHLALLRVIPMMSLCLRREDALR